MNSNIISAVIALNSGAGRLNGKKNTQNISANSEIIVIPRSSGRLLLKKLIMLENVGLLIEIVKRFAINRRTRNITNPVIFSKNILTGLFFIILLCIDGF